jgi:hypothetical protein
MKEGNELRGGYASTARVKFITQELEDDMAASAASYG